MPPIGFEPHGDVGQITIPFSGKPKVSWSWTRELELSVQVRPVAIRSRLNLLPLETSAMGTPIQYIEPSWRRADGELTVRIVLNARRGFRIAQQADRVIIEIGDRR